MCLRQYLIAFYLILVSYSLIAQNGQYQFSRLDISNGLSNNQVNCIYKDKRGFMWFGTMSGLNKYDGYTFKIFKRDSKDSNSLSDDYIVNISEAPEGKLWIGTRNGYDIYDPQTERIDRNITAALAKLKLPVLNFNSVKKDSKGNFWFLYTDQGMYVYYPYSHKTQHFDKRSSAALHSNSVTDIEEDSHHNMWLAYSDGVIEKLDVNSSKVIYQNQSVAQANNFLAQTYKLTIDRDNALWIYSNSSAIGVYFIDPVKNISRHFDKNSSSPALNTNIINSIVQADNGIMWIATDHGGINLVNKADFKVQYLLNREDDIKSIGQNSCTVYKDDQGIIWLGTYKRGISYYHENIIKFPVYRHFASDPNSLNYEDVNRFTEDDAGNLWIGTNGGGLIYFNRKAGKYTQYKHDAQNNNSLSNDVIVSLCIDHDKKLWIGSYFGGLDCFDGKTFVHYKHSSKDTNSISDDRVYSILEDSSHRLWVGAFAGGLNLFRPESKSFFHYKPFQPNSINSGLISSIFEDKDQNLWFGGYYGVDVLMKKTGKFVHYIHQPGNPNSLVMDNISTITQDSRGLIWIGTLEGVDIFDPKAQKFTLLFKDNGLPDNSVINILEDDHHSMWLSTPKGLCNIALTPDANKGFTYKFRNFDETDGLQGREFNANAAFKTKKGELVFGGAKGFNLFMPDNISINTRQPVLALTDFQIFNNSLSPGQSVDGHVILSRSITETSEITLNYNESAFSLEFADLNFFNPGKIKLQYKLDGFNKNWLESDIKTRKATYTNLDPGSYTFKVRAINSNGQPYPKTLSLAINILPPLWKTGWAYALYLASFISILFYIRKQGIQKIETRFALERERQEASHLHELDMMKIKFFTNVSHEFRTPISLIMAPVEKLIKQSDDKNDQRKLQLIHQNAKRLLNMINQLLDFSKIAVQKIQLDLTEGDIIKSIEDACTLFIDVAERKHIKFKLHNNVEPGIVFFDKDKIERILFNLLSNAIKFTPENGTVEVYLKLIEADKEEKTILEIKVKDSGIGIPAEKHEKIFERFFQNDIPASLINQGSGIGLSITKEFVDLMDGAISVESELKKGSCFIVRLPLKISKGYNIAPIKESGDVGNEIQKAEVIHHEKRDKSTVILIVEDNHDFRTYLKDDLSQFYTVAEATNGKEGWQKALALHPNLIISDINMAESDGIDLCKKIRADKRTEHIPFILLTAFTGEEQQLAGLETGANDYLTKPFNFEILHFKVRNLLKHQQSVKQTYQKQIDTKPGELEIETPDVKFMKKVLAVVEKNIPNAGFSVELLSDEMNMSRVALYKKIFNLSGKTPIEFIKSVRLKRAIQLLETNQYTIAEIAYQVGYNDPRYFARAFKTEFKVLPSHYSGKQE
jgi:signal transduction histidine kinase/ligand-binding sensor domain-containing protein/CheY-like chemotaxis protein/AraC-like DNA-binding protein